MRFLHVTRSIWQIIFEKGSFSDHLFLRNKSKTLTWFRQPSRLSQTPPCPPPWIPAPSLRVLQCRLNRFNYSFVLLSIKARNVFIYLVTYGFFMYFIWSFIFLAYTRGVFLRRTVCVRSVCLIYVMVCIF